MNEKHANDDHVSTSESGDGIHLFMKDTDHRPAFKYWEKIQEKHFSTRDSSGPKKGPLWKWGKIPIQK